MKDQKLVQATVVSGFPRDENQMSQRLALFNPDGSPLTVSGAPTVYYHAEAELAAVENNDLPTLMPFEGQPEGVPGAYLAKLHVNLGVGAPTNGLANVQIVHVDADDVETALIFVELNTLHDAEGYGDVQLGPNGSATKMDFAVFDTDGEFRVYASQNTDQHPMSFWAEVSIVKL